MEIAPPPLPLCSLHPAKPQEFCYWGNTRAPLGLLSRRMARGLLAAIPFYLESFTSKQRHLVASITPTRRRRLFPINSPSRYTFPRNDGGTGSDCDAAFDIQPLFSDFVVPLFPPPQHKPAPW